ncbi:MAG: S24 family peptidase [Ginsengibacter sp.]
MKIVPLSISGEDKLSKSERCCEGETGNIEKIPAPNEINKLLNLNPGIYLMKISTPLMEQYGVAENDLIIVDPEENVLTGKMVVVKMDGALMIRLYQRLKSGVLLYGDSTKIAPLKIDSDYHRLEIIGVVIYVIKQI